MLYSPYHTKSLKKKSNNAMYLAYVMIFIMPLSILGVFKHQAERTSRRSSFIRGLIEGISEGSVIEISVSLVVGLLLVFATKKLMENFQKKTKLVVGIGITESEIKLITKNAKDVIVDRALPVSNIKIALRKKEMDGIGHGEFECIVFKDRQGRLLGKIFKNHFTWTQEQVDQIENELINVTRFAIPR